MFFALFICVWVSKSACRYFCGGVFFVYVSRFVFCESMSVFVSMPNTHMHIFLNFTRSGEHSIQIILTVLPNWLLRPCNKLDAQYNFVSLESKKGTFLIWKHWSLFKDERNHNSDLVRHVLQTMKELSHFLWMVLQEWVISIWKLYFITD